MMFARNRKPFVMAVIGAAVIFGSYAFSPAPEQQDNPENNLKFLPKDISHDDLMLVMHSFEAATGMNCGDCHAHSTTDPNKMDWAADTKHKETTINMMKMVQELNKQYFAVEGDFLPNYLQSQYKVTCNSCHNGHDEPNSMVTLPVPDKR